MENSGLLRGKAGDQLSTGEGGVHPRQFMSQSQSHVKRQTTIHSHIHQPTPLLSMFGLREETGVKHMHTQGEHANSNNQPAICRLPTAATVGLCSNILLSYHQN